MKGLFFAALIGAAHAATQESNYFSRHELEHLTEAQVHHQTSHP